jgi:hypothetical protein
MIQQEMMKNWIGEEIANRSTVSTPRRTDAPISKQTSPVTKAANPTATRNVPPPPQAEAKAAEAESANRPGVLVSIPGVAIAVHRTTSAHTHMQVTFVLQLAYHTTSPRRMTKLPILNFSSVLLN